jgi:hypothetical protein
VQGGHGPLKISDRLLLGVDCQERSLVERTIVERGCLVGTHVGQDVADKTLFVVVDAGRG